MTSSGASEEGMIVGSDVQLGPAEAEQWAENGFVQWQRFLTPRGLDRLRSEVDAVLREKHPGVDSEWMQNIHQFPQGQWLWELANSAALVKVAEHAVGGGPLILYGSQIAVRYPSDLRHECNHPVVTPLHQDAPGSKVCTFWITLDHVDRQSGGLVVLRGIHKQGRQKLKRIEKVSELALAEKMASHNVFEIDLEHSTIKRHSFAYRLRAGGAGMHDPSLPHGSGPNLGHKPRRVIILRFMHVNELTPNDGGRMRHWKSNEWFLREYPRISIGKSCIGGS